MITVQVHTIGLLKSLIRQGELALTLPDGATVGDVLARLAETYGPQAAAHLMAPVAAGVHPPLRVTVNGRDIGSLDERGTALADGDDVLVMTPVAGG